VSNIEGVRESLKGVEEAVNVCEAYEVVISSEQCKQAAAFVGKLLAVLETLAVARCLPLFSHPMPMSLYYSIEVEVAEEEKPLMKWLNVALQRADEARLLLVLYAQSETYGGKDAVTKYYRQRQETTHALRGVVEAVYQVLALLHYIEKPKERE
jgi:hypothetical protein